MVSFISFISLACFFISAFAQSCSKSKACPLNACCSQYGNCGYGPDFCGTGCLSNCGPISKPSCSPNSNTAANIRVGYYTSWADNRACDPMSIKNINPNLWTHINFAFAVIDQSTFQITPSSNYDLTLYPQFATLKQKNPNLKVFISVGGGAVGGKAFSTMSSSSANRAAFINSVVNYLSKYGFDGIDIDWEYPVSTDTNGSPADYANFVSLVKELKAKIGNLGLTVTIPATYYYMQYYDLKSMEPYVNWFNVMAYDLQGLWTSPAVVLAHTNLTDIDNGMQALWSAGISASKVVMGTALYGRSYTLANPSCTTPGCPFSGAGTGNCMMSEGMSLYEVQKTIAQLGVTPILDKTAAVKYMTYNKNQWISFDDKDTIKLKSQYANSLCLGGMMTWSIDLDSPDQAAAAMMGGGAGAVSASSSMTTSTTSRTTTSSSSSRTTTTSTTTSSHPTSSSSTKSTSTTTSRTSTSTSNTSKTTTTSTTTTAKTTAPVRTLANAKDAFVQADSHPTTTTTTTSASRCITTACSSPPPAAPTPENVTAGCKSWVVAQEEDTCRDLAAKFGTTAKQFRKWNSISNSDCDGLEIGLAYCVSA